ncbi:Hypothetical protein NTJ_06572 [Nesidiocoris tenuis]|uniref:Uncharacterized protein n=1 Tax=Nesidiocoris tenuis TaxID=355587 RepID=A0ABN7ANG1_9HEMI|nr:Hypothetical protein NTJ_06572 [Nesidiocoris tenuis]
MEVLKTAAKQVFTVCLFNPEGVQVAFDFFKGQYEVIWIVLMMIAVVMVNIRFWNIPKDQLPDTPISVARAVGEALLHWSLSNTAFFLCLEAHKLVYGLFTEFVPAQNALKTHGSRCSVLEN